MSPFDSAPQHKITGWEKNESVNVVITYKDGSEWGGSMTHREFVGFYYEFISPQIEQGLIEETSYSLAN